MATLKFKGPFHWDHLISKNPSNPCGQKNSLVPPKKPGIYIWGFMYNLKDGQLNQPVDYSNGGIPPFNFNLNCITDSKKGTGPIGVDFKTQGWKFIPYYVGLDANLLGRIQDHHNIQSGNKWQYTRLTLNAYRSFFISGEFPILLKGVSRASNDVLINNYVDQFARKNSNSPIEYFNSKNVLNNIYNPVTGKLVSLGILTNGFEAVSIKNSWPYNQQKSDKERLMGSHITPGSSVNNIDSLNYIINDLNNFWYCYAELDNTTKSYDTFNNLTDLELYTLVNKNFLEYPEAQTYYSLKGITISKTLKYGTSNPFGLNFKIDAEPTCMDIFKQNPINTIVNNTNFPGY